MTTPGGRIAWAPDAPRELREIITAMPHPDGRAVSVLDAGLRFVAATPEVPEFLGVTLPRLLGLDFTRVDFVGCDLDGRLLGNDEHPAAVALRTGEPVLESVLGFEPRSGGVAPFEWFSLDVFPVVGTGGALVGVVGYVEVITGSEAANLATSQVVRNYRAALGAVREDEARFRALAVLSIEVGDRASVSLTW